MAVRGRPKSCKVYFKLRSESPKAIRLGNEMLNEEGSDENVGADGRQALGAFEVTHDPDSEKYDLFYVSYNEQGEGQTVKLNRTDYVVDTSESLADDDAELTVAIDTPDDSTMFKAGDVVSIDDSEICVISSVDSTPPWGLTFEERGAHGSARSAHSSGVEIRLLKWSVPTNSRTLTSLSAVTTPSSLNVNSGDGSFRFHWQWSGTDDEYLALKGFRFYYKTSSGVTINDSTLGRMMGGVGGLEDGDKPTVWEAEWAPTDGTYVRGETPFYFRVVAVLVNWAASDLSNEVGPRYISSTGGPTATPSAPIVNLTQSSKYKLRVDVLRDLTSNTIDKDVASIEVQLYHHATDATPDATEPYPGSDTLVNTTTYTLYQFPTHIEIAVNDYGDGEYWARARKINSESDASAWGLSDGGTVLVVNLTTGINDTDVVAHGDIVSAILLQGDVGDRVYYIISWGAQGYDSIINGRFKYREHADGASFDRTLDDPFTGSEWEAETFNAREYVEHTPISPEGYPFESGTFDISAFPLPKGARFEICFAIENAYGWSDWTTPISLEVPIEDVPDLGYPGWTPDADVATIEKFNAYTQATPPAGGDEGDIPGNQVRFGIQLGDNADSVFSLQVVGWKTTESEPLETVILDDSGETAYADTGTSLVEISGYSASVNEFSNAGNWFRIGKKSGSHTLPGTVIQEWKIASNTAGNPFTLTLSGTYRVAHPSSSASNPIDDWQIYDEPVYQIAVADGGFHKEYWVHTDRFVTGTWSLTTPNVQDYFYENIKNATTMKFKARVHNTQGRTAWHYATATDTPNLSVSFAVAKTIGGIDTPDIEPEAVDTTIVSDDAGFASHTVHFTSSSGTALAWDAGDIYYDNGNSDSIGSSSISGLTADVVYHVYYDITANTVKFTRWTGASWSNDNPTGPNHQVLGWAYTSSSTGVNAAFVSRGDGGITTGAVGFFANLESVMSRTGNLVTTGSQGITIQAGGNITFAPDDATPSEIIFTGAGSIRAPSTNIGLDFLAASDGSDYIRMGTTSNRWLEASIFGQDNVRFYAYGDATHYSNVYMWYDGVTQFSHMELYCIYGAGNIAEIDLYSDYNGGAPYSTITMLLDTDQKMQFTDSVLEIGTGSGGTGYDLPYTDGSANEYLKTDGSGGVTWSVVSGAGVGDVSYSSGYTDHAIARFDGDGQTIQGYTSQHPTISDDGEVHIPAGDQGHCIGVTPSPSAFITFNADYTNVTSTAGFGNLFNGTMQAAVGENQYMVTVGGILASGASGTNARMCGIYIAAPNITDNGATITTSAALYLAGVATEATYNWGIYVVDGVSRLNRLNVSGTATAPATGAGLELFYSGGSSYVQSYDRSASYIPIAYRASEHRFWESGSVERFIINETVADIRTGGTTFEMKLATDDSGWLTFDGDDQVASLVIYPSESGNASELAIAGGTIETSSPYHPYGGGLSMSGQSNVNGAGWFHIVTGGRGVAAASVAEFALTAVTSGTYYYNQILWATLESEGNATLRPGYHENLGGNDGVMNVDLGNTTFPFQDAYFDGTIYTDKLSLSELIGDDEPTNYDEAISLYSGSNYLGVLGKYEGENLAALELGNQTTYAGAIALVARTSSTAIPGYLAMQDRDGSGRFMWFNDVSPVGFLRVAQGAPVDGDDEPTGWSPPHFDWLTIYDEPSAPTPDNYRCVVYFDSDTIKVKYKTGGTGSVQTKTLDWT